MCRLHNMTMFEMSQSDKISSSPISSCSETTLQIQGKESGSRAPSGRTPGEGSKVSE